MKKLLLLASVLLVTGCDQMKGGDPVVTTSGKVPNPVTSKAVTIRWKQSTGVVQGYEVSVAVPSLSFEQRFQVDPNYGGMQIALPTGVSYQIRVRAYNQGGNSAFTSAANLTL